MIDINVQQNIMITEDTILYLQQSYVNFDLSKLILTYDEENTNHDYFKLYYSYSYDKINYSDFKLISDFVIQDNSLSVYLAIKFVKSELNDLQKVITIKQTQNVDKTIYKLSLKSLAYGISPNISSVDLTDESLAKFKTIYHLINQYPKWNLYDGNSVIIDRWLNQCNAIAEMYGHTCIYFKTEPVENKTVHTFANHVFRNVVNIKKLHILFPNNEIPQDRNVYTDWDMPLQDDFVAHIVINKFELAFGENKIPVEKDYLYLPLINKLFRVTSTQPKTGFMGKIGWWEVFLAKFEEDDCVSIDDDLKSAMLGVEDFDLAMDSINDQSQAVPSEVFNEITDMLDDTLVTDEKIMNKTIEEKKTATDNFENKLVDSNIYISLKETEKLREYYDRRLKIVTVSVDNSIFPINMYDCKTIDTNIVAMQYLLTDFTVNNKFSNTISTDFAIHFNYVELAKFNGSILSLYNSTSSKYIFSIASNRTKKLSIVDSIGTSYLIDFELIDLELYYFDIVYTKSLNQISVKIYSLKNKTKLLEYENIYIIAVIDASLLMIDYLHLFGGNCYLGQLQLQINNNKILDDKVTPLLSKQFF